MLIWCQLWNCLGCECDRFLVIVCKVLVECVSMVMLVLSLVNLIVVVWLMLLEVLQIRVCCLLRFRCMGGFFVVVQVQCVIQCSVKVVMRQVQVSSGKICYSWCQWLSMVFFSVGNIGECSVFCRWIQCSGVFIVRLCLFCVMIFYCFGCVLCRCCVICDSVMQCRRKQVMLVSSRLRQSIFNGIIWYF